MRRRSRSGGIPIKTRRRKPVTLKGRSGPKAARGRSAATVARRLEQSLRENEERYALVSEAVAEGIYDWNIKLNSLFVSPRLMEIFGFEGSGLTSEDWSRRVHPHDRENYRTALRDCFKQRTLKLECQYRIKAADGNYRWVEDRGLPIRNETGRAIRLVGAVNDISQRRQTEQALRDSEQRYALAMQAINEGVYDWNIATDETYYSPRVRDVVGLAPKELGSRTDWLARIHPDDLFAYKQAFAAHLKGETDRLTCEYRYLHPDGTWHWVRQHGLALRDQAGRAYRVAGSTGDVTAEKELARQRDSFLQDLNAVLDTIDYGVLFMGPDLRAKIINRAFRQMWGISDEFIRNTRPTMSDLINYNRNNNLYDIAPSAFDDYVARRVEAVRAGTAAMSEIRRRDGRIIQYQMVALPDGGRMLTYFDITDIRRGEEQARTLLFELRQRTDDLTEALEQQTATADMLEVISRSTFDLPAVLNTLVESAAKLCDADCAFIFRFEDGDYRLAASHGFSEEYRQFIVRNPIKPGRGTLVGRTALEARTVHLPDCLADPEYVWTESQKIGGFRTMLGVPLLREGNSIGVIALTRSAVKPFNGKQIELIETFADQAVIAIENVRLFEAEQQRTSELSESLEQQTATAKILSVISNSLNDTQPVFDAIVQSGMRLFPGAAIFIALADAQEVRAVAIAESDPDRAEAWRRRFPFPLTREYMHSVAILDRRMLDIPDVENAPDEMAAGKKNFLASGYRAVTIMPMMRGEAAIGALSVVRRESGPLSDKQLAALRTFAAQAVIAIENTRLLSELRESLQQQNATADVLKVISRSTFDLPKVLSTLVESATKLCNADKSYIYQQHDGAYQFAASYGFSAELLEYARQNPISAGRGTITGRVVLAGKTVHVEDVLADPEFTGHGYQSRGDFRTTLGVPLTRNGMTIGVFFLARSLVRPFTNKEIDLVTTFADQAVIAIENTRLLNELRQRTDDLSESLEQQTATSEVLSVISSSPGELEPVFQTMLENAVQICDAKFGVLYRYDNEAFDTVAMFGATPEHAEYLRQRGPFQPIAGTTLDRLLRTKEVVRVADGSASIADGSAEPLAGTAAKFGGARSLINVPMLKEHVLIGAITIYRQEVRPFEDKQIELVQNFAAQAVIAIENTRLLNELRHARRSLLEQQTATSEVLSVISSSPGELEPVFQTMLENAVRICDAKFGVLWRYDDETFDPAALFGLTPAHVEFDRQRGSHRPAAGSSSNACCGQKTWSALPTHWQSRPQAQRQRWVARVRLSRCRCSKRKS